MFNQNFDPFETLEQLQVAAMSHGHEIEDAQGRLVEQAKLMEMLANQVKHLTNAVIGLQQQNQILIHRVNKLEGIDLD